MTQTLREVGGMLNNAPDVVAALRRSIAENAELQKQVEEYFKEKIAGMVKNLLAEAREVNGVKLVTLNGIRIPDVVKNVAFGVRASSPEATAFVAATADMSGKPLLTVMLTDDLVKRGMNASVMVREAAKAIKGGGGGQPGFAQAGGKNKDGLLDAYNTLVSAF